MIMKNKISILSLGRKLGISSRIIKAHIDAGNIDVDDNGLVDSEYINIIAEQQQKYVGIKAFIQSHNEERFNPTMACDRNKYIDFLEVNDYFGAKIITIKDVVILFDNIAAEDFYLLREDLPLINSKSEEFFYFFGLTEKEKIEKKIKDANIESKKHFYLRKYLKGIENNNYPPVVTRFVDIIINLPPLLEIEDEDIAEVFEAEEKVYSKGHVKDFLNMVSQNEAVKYGVIRDRKTSKKAAPAYPYEQYIKLVRMLFNEDYIDRHGMIERAFSKHQMAEAWLFLCLHFICGWRAADICNNWIYPEYTEEYNPLNIDLKDLKHGIITKAISDDVYEKVANYVIKKIELANKFDSKTARWNPSKLRVEATKDLRIAIGRLTLIGISIHMSEREGYMKAERIGTYCNWVNCKEFFGEEFIEAFGRNNIQTRRLNKSYLQGAEKNALDLGYAPIVAHMIASYARNHNDIETTLIYLRDRGLTGETAELVLYLMMQRGVMGASMYAALCDAYPDEFGKLTKQEQTQIMEKISLSAYDLEVLGPSLLNNETIRKDGMEGKHETTSLIIKEMFEIGQGRGSGKDKGVYCKKRALGYSCEHPSYKSCISGMCRYHVLTTDGIPALLDVLKEYKRLYTETGNKKYQIVLYKHILPYYQDIINEILRAMSKEERTIIRGYIGEKINGD